MKEHIQQEMTAINQLLRISQVLTRQNLQGNVKGHTSLQGKGHTNVQSVTRVSFENGILRDIKGRRSMQEMTAVNQLLWISEVLVRQKYQGKVKGQVSLQQKSHMILRDITEYTQDTSPISADNVESVLAHQAILSGITEFTQEKNLTSANTVNSVTVTQVVFVSMKRGITQE